MDIKPKVKEEAVQLNDIPWKAFPDALSKGASAGRCCTPRRKWTRGPQFSTALRARRSMRIFTSAQANIC